MFFRLETISDIGLRTMCMLLWFCSVPLWSEGASAADRQTGVNVSQGLDFNGSMPIGAPRRNHIAPSGCGKKYGLATVVLLNPRRHEMLNCVLLGGGYNRLQASINSSWLASTRCRMCDRTCLTGTERQSKFSPANSFNAFVAKTFSTRFRDRATGLTCRSASSLISGPT
jgi:hypothetical protein